MESIRIQNLRCLGDTGQIKLPPISVLVGSNSSGKSTFLRFFPLMKQSFGKKINGPILWADEDDYVDFGSYAQAMNRNSEEKKISFEFEMDISKNRNLERMYFEKRESSEKIKVEYVLEKIENVECVSEIRLVLFERSFIFKIDKDFLVNEASVDGRTYRMEEKDFISRHLILNKNVFNISLRNNTFFAIRKINEILGFFSAKELDDVLFDANLIFNCLFNERILKNRKNATYYVKKMSEAGREKLKDFNLVINALPNEKLIFLDDMLLLYEMDEIYDTISDALYAYFRNVYYIAPVRATAQRYYQLFNIAVNEVDCRGKNLAIFLNSLTETQFKEFQKFTDDNLGFRVEKSLSEGHISLKVKKSGASKAVNLSDTGFGYSQILPIITQIWYIVATMKVNKKNGPDIPITVAIEQPELHLHPALQAKLIDVIVKVMQQSKQSIKFIIETHSETMINRFGNLIYKNKLNKEDINVYVFDKELGDEDTTIRESKYDEDGYLENWPIGFFEPEEVL